MKSQSEVQKLVEVARMYYEGNMTQAEIAKKLKVSRPLVSKLLDKAREAGIVIITIKDPCINNEFLMLKLKKLYQLQGGIVVPEIEADYLNDQFFLNHLVYYLKSIISNTTRLGLGWGLIIGSLVDRVQYNELSGKGAVCPLIGNITQFGRAFHSNELVRIFAEKCGLTAYSLYNPAFPGTLKELDIYTNTDNYRRINELWSGLDAVLLGISSHPFGYDETVFRSGKVLGKEKAVGNFLSYFFDMEGNIVAGDNNLVIQVPFEKLKMISKVIGIADKNIKADAVIGALKTGVFTHLIISEKIAQAVIDNFAE